MRYFALLIFFTLISCFELERNCSSFKTGKFESELVVNGQKLSTSFERNDSLQIENFNNKIDTFTVRWVNDCEYILENKKPKNLVEKKAIQVRIIKTTENQYTYEYSYVGDTKKQQGTVTKVK